ncbi:LOW QUALITY PROTEIN: metastasis-associated protein MTA1 [Brachyhypopomus gauderio]|uniref:LOW QUALITY PROTEIN: metastasis-associated protein MTA1 n=1 Tax=Brachyhypopomus gauderio TaxID=698409 RepID=UPI0040415764
MAANMYRVGEDEDDDGDDDDGEQDEDEDSSFGDSTVELRGPPARWVQRGKVQLDRGLPRTGPVGTTASLTASWEPTRTVEGPGCTKTFDVSLVEMPKRTPLKDAFFYSLVYDPQQKTLLADKGEIRVGNKYQAEITDLLKEGEGDGREQAKLEEKVWDPSSPVTEKQIDQFLVDGPVSAASRSLSCTGLWGRFARALDCSSSVRQPSLHMSAAAASRDITLFHAMDTLHKNGYDMTRAIAALVPQGGPVLCRDEMEEWSASEANLFEEALEKYGKDFADIQQDFLPWKSLTSIIEYYYMWKTTDRYVQQKRLKAAEAESKLKQVYIPNYNKPNPNQLSANSVKPGLVNGAAVVPGTAGQPPGLGRACESCYTTNSYQWYSWGPSNMQCRLCASCWTYWKKYGGLKMPTRLDGERPGPNRNNLSPHGVPVRHGGSPKFAVKTRQAFYLQTTPLTRMARRVCQDLLRSRYVARHPYIPVNTTAIKAECAVRLPDMSKKPVSLKQAVRKPLESVVRYLEAHPCPPKPDPPRGASISMGSLTPIKSTPILNNGSPTILGKRTYEQHNGLDGSKPKVLGPQWEIMSKRVSEQGRPPSAMQDNEVHELD